MANSTMMCDGSIVAAAVTTQQEVQHQRRSCGSIATATANEQASASDITGFAAFVASSK